MPQCPTCRASYIVGQLYCPACGHLLPTPSLWAPRNAAPKPNEPPPTTPPAPAAPEVSPPAAREAATAKPQHLWLQLPTGTLIDLPERKITVLGRKDNESTPDVDLASYGGEEKGVSRLHAMIMLDNGRYYIRDLESTNNTLLNHARLFPEQLYPLNHNDYLTLGELEMRVLLRTGEQATRS